LQIRQFFYKIGYVIIGSYEAIELLMQSFKNLVEELDKAGCIKDGMKEKALKIADSLVSKWYGQIAGFIKKLLSPNHLPHILSV